jgi:hypothetical protein
MRELAILVLATSTTFAATWDQLPVVDGVNQVSPTVIESDLDALHPWKAGRPLPTSFEDAGLTAPVELVAFSMYYDGGSRYYIFGGANKKYLMVCTDRPAVYSQADKKLVRNDVPALYLRAAHVYRQTKVPVPRDSACERFLLKAIRDEVDRITALQEQKKRQLNKLPLPTSANGTPAADALVAPPPGAAGG